MTAKKEEFASIVESHLPSVYRIALRILGVNADAEDATQIVFAEALRLHLQKDIRDWNAFLARLATHRSLDLLRKRTRRSKTIDLDTLASSIPEPYLAQIGKEAADWLRDQLAKLPEKQAAAFVLVCLEGRDRTEVALILETTPESISTMLHRARQKLQRSYQLWEKGINT